MGILSLFQSILDKIRFKFFVTEAQRLKEINLIIEMIEVGKIHYDIAENKEFLRKINNIKRRLKNKSTVDIIDALLEESSRRSLVFIENKDSINRLSSELLKEYD